MKRTRTMRGASRRLWATGALVLLQALAAAGEGAEPATIVILPPHVKAGDAKTHAAAELLCDRLAMEVAKASGVKVVDRTQIDRVLAEHKLGSAPAKPAWSFDAIVRMEVAADRADARVSLRVVDLSLGNVVGAGEYPFRDKPDPGTLARMAALCRKAARVAAESPEGLKVRLVQPVVVARIRRLVPLAEELGRTFEQALLRSPRVCLVRHLEAATAKEESLLILLGHTRLPGGRQFAPQADVTLELRLAEADAVGKTFDQTVLEIQYRLAERAAAGHWRSLKGTRAEWDRLLVAAWKAVAKDISGANPDAAADFLSEMAIRRRQAQAEVERLRNLGATGYSDVGCGREVHTARKAEIARIASVAAKLDPTNEEAVYVATKFSFWQRKEQARGNPSMLRELYRQSLRECLHFLSAFESNEEWRHETACVAETAYHAILEHGRPKPDSAPLAADLLELVVRAFEAVQKERTNGCGWTDAHCIKTVYEHLLKSGAGTTSARQWRDRQLRQLDRKLLPTTRPATNRRWSNRHRDLLFCRCVAAEYAIDEGQPERARQLLMEYLQAEVFDSRMYPASYLPRLAAPLVKVAGRLKDPELNARLQEWLEGKVKPAATLEPLTIRWPDSPLTKDLQTVSVPETKTAITLKGQAKPWYAPHVLGVCDGRIYLMGHTNNTASYVYTSESGPDSRPLPGGRPPHSQGRAVFGYLPLTESGAVAGEALVELPLPRPEQVRGFPSIMFSTVVGRILCVGTEGQGLLAFDPKQAKWAAYSPADGLPGSSIRQFLPLGRGSALCVGYEFRKSVSWTLDLATGRAVLRRRGHWRDEFPAAAWWRNGKLAGVVSQGIVDDLLAERWSVRAWPKRLAYWGWGAGYSVDSEGRGASVYPDGAPARCAGRRFVVMRDGLWELDDRDRAVRHWPSDANITLGAYPAAVPGACYVYRRVPLPGIFPECWLIGCDQRFLYLCSTKGIIAFEPATDAWYGPVGPTLQQRPVTYRAYYWATRDYLWHQGYDGRRNVTTLDCLAKEDLLAAARKAGRVATTSQLQRRLRRHIESAGELDQAKLAYCLHRFDRSRALLEEVLRDDPNEPEALLLMGLVHEKDPSGDRRAALTCYRRLASLPGNLPANLAGEFLLLDLVRGYDLPGALAMGGKILAKYETLAPAWRQAVEGLNANTIVRMGKATQPAPAGPSE